MTPRVRILTGLLTVAMYLVLAGWLYRDGIGWQRYLGVVVAGLGVYRAIVLRRQIAAQRED